MNLLRNPKLFLSRLQSFNQRRSQACAGAKVSIAATITSTIVMALALVTAVIVAPIAMLRRYVQTAAVVSAIVVVATIAVIVRPWF